MLPFSAMYGVQEMAWPLGKSAGARMFPRRPSNRISRRTARPDDATRVRHEYNRMEPDDQPQRPEQSESDRSAKRLHRKGLRRVQVACERCRARKNKCDANLPECRTCMKAGAPCVYIDRLTGSARTSADEHVSQLEQESERLRLRVSELETLLQTQNHSTFPRDGPVSHVVPNRSTMASPEATRMAQTVSTHASSHSIADDISTVARGIRDPQRFVGESSGAFFGSLIKSVVMGANYKPDQDRCGRRLPLRVQNQTLNIENDPDPPPLPSQQQAELLVDHFTRNRWPSFPFLHMPSFREQHLAAVMSMGYGARHVSLFLVLMVFALGSLDAEHHAGRDTDLHQRFFGTATARYFNAVALEDGESTVQGLLLLGLYALNEADSVNGWHVAGQAVRVAVDLGMHRASNSSNILIVELRKRMFWSAYCMDRNISIALGRPFAIRDQDIVVDFPCDLTDNEISPADSIPSFMLPQDAAPMNLSTFLHVIRLRQLQSRIHDVFYPACQRDLEADRVARQQRELSEELRQWLRSAPLVRNGTNFQALEWPQIAYSHSLLLIFRPNPVKQSVSVEDLQICADSALTLITSYFTLYSKNKMVHTWIALHSIFMAAVTMLYTLVVSAQVRSSTRKSIVQSNVAMVVSLFEALDDTWPLASRCREIIQNLGQASIALFKAQQTTDRDDHPMDAQTRSITKELTEWLNTHQMAARQQTVQNNENMEFTAASADTLDATELQYAQLPSMQELDDLFFFNFDVDLPLPP